MILRSAICLVLLLLTGSAFAEDAKNRVALVIGNATYRRAALANPVNDAKLMAERLKAQGFEVFPAYDANQRDMKRAVQNFAASLRERGKDAVAFIFYAGHGVQVKGENYLIPVDEHIESEGDVDIDAVSLSSIMSMLENTQTRLAIVVLDACRVNPFGYARGGERGLARVDAPSGSLVAFSTSPGKAAQDGEGSNSIYTAALEWALAEPGLKIEEVFKKVRIAVREKTKGEQTPWESTSLTGDFYPAGEKQVALPAEQPARYGFDSAQQALLKQKYGEVDTYGNNWYVGRDIAVTPPGYYKRIGGLNWAKSGQHEGRYVRDVVTIKQCEKECLSDLNCLAFSWERTAGLCDLYNNQNLDTAAAISTDIWFKRQQQ